MATTVRMTADDLLTLPDDGWRYELIRGELQRMAPDNFDHGQFGDNVQYPLSMHVRRHRLGRVVGNVGFTLETDPDTVLAPDVSFIRTERLPARGGRGFPEMAPDLAVEVLSPSNTAGEIARKTALYLANGVRVVWVIDPASRTVSVYSSAGAEVLGESDRLDGGDVVPGFAMQVADLFA